jgi:thiosulfate reductase cytochrome b subunit
MAQTAQATAHRASARRLHPLPVRIMHWINALAIFIMIGSGWKIYNDDILFPFLRFPDAIVIGKWAQYGLQWHFFGMWIFVLNGLAYLGYGIVSGRFRQKLFPISPREVVATIGEARCACGCATTISRITTPYRRCSISASWPSAC